jgi:hypothetical protein
LGTVSGGYRLFRSDHVAVHVNYIVEDLDGVLEQLRAEGVWIDRSVKITTTAALRGSERRKAHASNSGSRRRAPIRNSTHIVRIDIFK